MNIAPLTTTTSSSPLRSGAGNPGIVPPWLENPGKPVPSVWSADEFVPLPVATDGRMKPLPVIPRNLQHVLQLPNAPMPVAGDTFVPLPRG